MGEAAGQHEAEQDPFNATLIERRDLTAALAIVKVRPDSGVTPPFEPGQFATLGMPPDESLVVPDNSPRARRGRRHRLIRRAYSIASSAHDRDHLEFYVTLVPEGKLTTKLWTVDVGDRVWMAEQCKGTFTLDDVPEGKDLVMVATGTGLAPYMSMLRTYRGTQRWRRLVIVHGVRYASDLGYRDELEALAAAEAGFSYLPTVSREPAESGWAGLRGRVQVALEPGAFEAAVGAPLDPATCEVFLCGNPDMIDELQQVLEARGFVTDTMQEAGNLHFERYW